MNIFRMVNPNRTNAMMRMLRSERQNPKVISNME
jgi:hypothetical protein